jgi:hypothetical protein
MRFHALLLTLEAVRMRFMKRLFSAHSRKISAIGGLLFLLDVPRLVLGEPTVAATTGFNSYSRSVEVRLERQHHSSNGFVLFSLSNSKGEEARLRQGEVTVERIWPPANIQLPGALLHHWRGTAFAPGAKAADFERLMRDFSSYPQHFAPQVLLARASVQTDERIEAWMRVRQKHVVTVVMDTAYDVNFGQLDREHGYTISRSTRIDEIDSPNTKREHALSANEEHGFLWRQNTYWSYEERDGGLYLQIESVSLTRSIPTGFGWAIRPYVESIPRESLEFTLHSACNALRK